MALETTLAGGFPKIGDTAEEQKLRRALHQCDKGELSDEELERIKNEVTEEVIKFELDMGIDILTDGLIRWEDPLTYLARAIPGYSIGGLIRYFDTNTFYRQPIAESRLEYLKPFLPSDYQFAQERSTKPVKAVITGPYTLARLSKNTFYREFKQFVFDLTHILHREVQTLEEAGCRFIQFDEPALLGNKQDLSFFFQVYEILTAQPTRAEKTLFLNFGSIEGIYPKILELQVERIGLDLTKGHKNWSVIKSAPFTKKIMAGVIDSRNTKMEPEAELVQRIQQLGEIVNLDQTWLTTNHSLEFLPRANAKKKTELLVNVAKQFKGANANV